MEKVGIETHVSVIAVRGHIQHNLIIFRAAISTISVIRKHRFVRPHPSCIARTVFIAQQRLLIGIRRVRIGHAGTFHNDLAVRRPAYEYVILRMNRRGSLHAAS